MPNQTIKVTSPVKGVNRVVPREGQPPDTCWDALNVMPYDRFGRHRVAQRSGLAKQYVTNLGSTFVQGLLPVNNITYSGTFTSTGGASSTVLSTWINVPAGVTATSVITYPAAFSSAGTDKGPQFNSTVAGDGYTLNFNITLPGSVSDGTSFVWVFIDPDTNHTFANAGIPADSPRIQGYFQLDPSVAQNSQVNIISSTALTDQAFTGNTITCPLNTTIPCSISWSSTGVVRATFNGVSTDTNTGSGNAGFLTISPPGGGSRISFFSQNNGTGTNIQISGIQIVAGAGGTTTISTGQAGYTTLVIAVEGGNVWVGNQSTITKAANGQATPQLSITNYVSMAYESGVVYIVDGSSTVHTYTIATDTVGVLTASTGTVGGGSTSLYFLIANWRGRIVLAGDANSPQAYYMSRAGVPNDWNYAATDSAEAFAGQLGKAGLIGEPITALIPFSDDLIKMGCSHSMWMLQGDPADGGTITLVSNDMGIVGKDAWCVDPAGTLWFVATGGLFSVRPAWEFYRPPEAVSLHSVNQNFTGLDPAKNKVTLVFDADLHYLHIFVSPLTGAAGTHLTMDARSVGQEGPPGFWPQQFPAVAGPSAACLFFGDGNPNNRVILFGGFDGYIRSFNDNSLDDDGSTIAASVTMGPWQPYSGEAGVLAGLTINLGEVPVQLQGTESVPGSTGTNPWNAEALMAAGPDAYAVTEALGNSQNPYPIPIVEMGTIDRRQKTFRQRIRGAWFTLTLRNQVDSTFFSFESAVMEFNPGGRERRWR